MIINQPFSARASEVAGQGERLVTLARFSCAIGMQSITGLLTFYDAPNGGYEEKTLE